MELPSGQTLTGGQVVVGFCVQWDLCPRNMTHVCVAERVSAQGFGLHQRPSILKKTGFGLHQERSGAVTADDCFSGLVIITSLAH